MTETVDTRIPFSKTSFPFLTFQFAMLAAAVDDAIVGDRALVEIREVGGENGNKLSTGQFIEITGGFPIG